MKPLHNTNFPVINRRNALGFGALAGLAAVGFGGLTANAAPLGTYPPIDFQGASPQNYTVSDRPNSYALNYVVIHVTQETYADTLKLFNDPAHAACAHYVVRSADGHLAQCVQEKDIAWHAGNWDYNCRSIGVEHEGWVDQPSYFTDAMYKTSAQLVRAICDKYSIPIDRTHIIGHSEVPNQDHTDPGQYWDWDKYMGLVQAAA